MLVKGQAEGGDRLKSTGERSARGKGLASRKKPKKLVEKCVVLGPIL